MAARRPVPDSRSGFSGVMLVGSPDEMVTMVDPSDDATSRGGGHPAGVQAAA